MPVSVTPACQLANTAKSASEAIILKVHRIHSCPPGLDFVTLFLFLFPSLHFILPLLSFPSSNHLPFLFRSSVNYLRLPTCTPRKILEQLRDRICISPSAWNAAFLLLFLLRLRDCLILLTRILPVCLYSFFRLSSFSCRSFRFIVHSTLLYQLHTHQSKRLLVYDLCLTFTHLL